MNNDKKPKYNVGDKLPYLPANEMQRGNLTILQKNSHWIALMGKHINDYVCLEIAPKTERSKWDSRVKTLNERHKHESMFFQTRQIDDLIYFFGKLEESEATWNSDGQDIWK